MCIRDRVSGLHRFSAQPQDYDLVLMSALLPGLDAPVIAEKMLALNPDIRLAHLSSGANGHPQQSGLATRRIPCITNRSTGMDSGPPCGRCSTDLTR